MTVLDELKLRIQKLAAYVGPLLWLNDRTVWHPVNKEYRIGVNPATEKGVTLHWSEDRPCGDSKHWLVDEYHVEKSLSTKECVILAECLLQAETELKGAISEETLSGLSQRIAKVLP